jgi:hypothetical protein
MQFDLRRTFSMDSTTTPVFGHARTAIAIRRSEHAKLTVFKEVYTYNLFVLDLILDRA